MNPSVAKRGDRYVIVDETGNIIDDAQSHGYRSFNSARKSMWYKYGGGKHKMQSSESERRKLFKENPNMEKYISDFYMTWFKELSWGEVTEDDLIEEIEKEFGIVFPKRLLKGM